ncbi:MAG: ABC transporter permease [Clostridiales bacterium]|jgi:peptide/nickel transport system permease protein|nr:ABC transporter permease [Clostridiales bacterium]
MVKRIYRKALEAIPIKYILKRILQMVPVILGVTLLVFALLSFSPGDPAKIILGMQAKPSELELLREQLGLNDPVPVQYLNYMRKVLVGDFGTSYTTKQPVMDMIAVRLPSTMLLSFGSLIAIMAVSIPLGIALAVKQNSLFDNVMRVVSLILAAMPGFWLGIMMILLFSVRLGWLSASGLAGAKDLIMPVVCLSVSGWAVNSRLTRSSMLDVIKLDYIRTARAKGLRSGTVIRKHALKNALLPMITSIGIYVGSCFGGSVVIETVFGINGVGKMMVEALRQKDMPTILAGVIISAVVIAAANLLTDIAYAFADPRIKSLYVSHKRAGGGGREAKHA